MIPIVILFFTSSGDPNSSDNPERKLTISVHELVLITVVGSILLPDPANPYIEVTNIEPIVRGG